VKVDVDDGEEVKDWEETVKVRHVASSSAGEVDENDFP